MANEVWNGDEMTEVTLDFIARQIERVLSDNADVRDQLTLIRGELTVITARLSHIEASIESLQRQLGRMNDRIRKLEDAE